MLLGMWESSVVGERRGSHSMFQNMRELGDKNVRERGIVDLYI